MTGPETWVELNVSGPFTVEDYDILVEFVKLLRHHAEPRPDTAALDGEES